MAPRAENPNSLSGPTGPSLLDQSNATPADINPEIFKSRNPERQPTEGTVSSDYLKRTREEDPWPAESSCAPKTNTPAKTATVTLSDCRIDTPTEDLATDQPFQMSCQATTTDGSPLKGDIRFKLYCTLPDGTEEFTNHTVIGKRKGDRYAAEGTLFSPKKPVEWGAPLKYHLTAEHPGAGEKAKSGVAEVVGYMPPKPLAVWGIDQRFFDHETSFILPEAKDRFRELHEFLMMDVRPLLAIFAHDTTLVPTLASRRLASQRAFTVHSVLTGNPSGWLAKNFGLTTHMAGDPGIKTMRRIVRREDRSCRNMRDTITAYMSYIFEPALRAEDFIGDGSKIRSQWACSMCGSMNVSILGGAKCDSEQFHAHIAKSSILIFLFPRTTRSSKSVRFPCQRMRNRISPCTGPTREDGNEQKGGNGAENAMDGHQPCRFFHSLFTNRKMKCMLPNQNQQNLSGGEVLVSYYG